MKRNRGFRSACAALVVAFMASLMLAPSVTAASKFKTLHKFTFGKDGGDPYAGLVLDKAGNLYGTTPVAGAGGNGVVFKLSPNTDGSWTEHVLYSFKGPDGSYSTGTLIFDNAGNLYGTTQAGGNYGYGAVFKLTSTLDGHWQEEVIHSFNNDGEDGQLPYAGLVFDTAGSLYGTTNEGGAYGRGAVFKVIENADGSWSESVLHSFATSDGSFPRAGLVLDLADSLYGTTYVGGANNDGVVFKLRANADGSWSESVLHNFAGSDGTFPIAGLVFDQEGNLYGTTYLGGADDYGVVFKLKPSGHGSWTETVIHSFRTSGKDGITPFASLIFDGRGNLYGTTRQGGSHGDGAVFKLAPTSGGRWISTVLHTFLDRPGANPYSGLIFDAAGNLYGTSPGDEENIFGSVFQIMP